MNLPLLQTRRAFEELEQREDFSRRHLGPDAADQAAMLATLGLESMDALIDAVVPPAIRSTEPLAVAAARTEAEILSELRRIAERNQVFKSYIGMGYCDCHTPPVILRNILENPAWYTAYTPYQPEISQGRLEALLNFQTMIAELTGLEIANASMLDEGSAAAEAMAFCRRVSKNPGTKFFVAQDCHPQTIEVVQTRAEPLRMQVVVGDPATDIDARECFGVLLQYPASTGAIHDYRATIAQAHAHGAPVAVAADLLALTLLKPPGELGADVAVGSAQRFGVPMGYGGPHAAYFATRDAHKRLMPGRLVGVSIDASGDKAYRLAMQTREQHIRREKATSNICTAQVLLAVIASMYAVWHGPHGLRTIAERVQRLTATLAAGLRRLGCGVANEAFFDTLTVRTGARTAAVHAAARAQRINLRALDAETIGVSLDETTTRADVETLWSILAAPEASLPAFAEIEAATPDSIPPGLARTSAFLTHPVFSAHRSETAMLRYLRRLADKDLALDRTMIPLGSCTMKLNATTEMIPITWPEFGGLHPFAPAEQTAGYRQLIDDLERMLCACTGYDAVSLQPNAGSQGEYAGLLAIRAWHASRGEGHRDVCLIPSSAHGTNPASAVMAGMQVVVVPATNAATSIWRTFARRRRNMPAARGDHDHLSLDPRRVRGRGARDLRDRARAWGTGLHRRRQPQRPGRVVPARPTSARDVWHLNLHKTFCIPHGGGGRVWGRSASGPSGAVPARPSCPAGLAGIGAVSAAPWGSASILPISWAYIAMMGGTGLKQASEVAILNANYIAERLEPHYPVLYTGDPAWWRTSASSICARSRTDRHHGRGRREAPHGLRFPCADDVLPGRQER